MSYKPMKPEVKALWLSALLSGAYAQGEGYLRALDDVLDTGSEPRVEQYCCLGVLCDISPRGRWIKVNGDGRAFNNRFQRSFPPDSVYRWAGVDSDASAILARMNDNGSTFEDIAEWIDANL